jgi:hypothetical protein
MASADRSPYGHRRGEVDVHWDERDRARLAAEECVCDERVVVGSSVTGGGMTHRRLSLASSQMVYRCAEVL